MKKQNGISWLKKVAIIGGAIVGFGIILTSFVKVSVYIEAPKNIQANAEEIYDIKAYINEQRIANELMREMQQQKQYYPNQRQQQPYYPPSPREECWDSYYQEYYPCNEGEL